MAVEIKINQECTFSKMYEEYEGSVVLKIFSRKREKKLIYIEL